MCPSATKNAFKKKVWGVCCAHAEKRKEARVTAAGSVGLWPEPCTEAAAVVKASRKIHSKLSRLQGRGRDFQWAGGTSGGFLVKGLYNAVFRTQPQGQNNPM